MLAIKKLENISYGRDFTKPAKVDARFYGSNLLQHPRLFDDMRDLAIRASTEPVTPESEG